MTSISIKVTGLESARAIHDERIVGQALSRTLNEMANPVMADLTNNITENNLIPKARVKEAISVSQRASVSNPELIISAQGKTPGIQTYAVQADAQGHGVTVQIKSNGGRKALSNKAFYRKFSTGGSGVFSRYDRQGNLLGTTSRGTAKLRRLVGPSVPGLANTDGWDAVQATVDDRFDTRFNHNLEHLLLSK